MYDGIHHNDISKPEAIENASAPAKAHVEQAELAQS